MNNKLTLMILLNFLKYHFLKNFMFVFHQNMCLNRKLWIFWDLIHLLKEWIRHPFSIHIFFNFTLKRVILPFRSMYQLKGWSFSLFKRGIRSQRFIFTLVSGWFALQKGWIKGWIGWMLVRKLHFSLKFKPWFFRW